MNESNKKQTYIIDISKKIFIIIAIYTAILISVFIYWLYEELKPAKYEFEILYLDSADVINANEKYQSINCFSEKFDNEKQRKIYSCIGTKRR